MEREREIYSELGKKNQSEGGKKGMKSRWRGNDDKDITLAKSSQSYSKVNTNKEIADHANISRTQATKIIYINKNLDLTNEEHKKIKRQLEVYSSVTLQNHQRKLFTKLGKERKVEAGKAAIEKRWNGNEIGLSEFRQTYPEPIDTLDEIAKHAKTSRDTVAKVNYINDFF